MNIYWKLRDFWHSPSTYHGASPSYYSLFPLRKQKPLAFWWRANKSFFKWYNDHGLALLRFHLFLSCQSSRLGNLNFVDWTIDLCDWLENKARKIDEKEEQCDNYGNLSVKIAVEEMSLMTIIEVKTNHDYEHYVEIYVE